MIADCGHIFSSTILTEKLKDAGLAATADDCESNENRKSRAALPARPEATQIPAIGTR